LPVTTGEVVLDVIAAALQIYRREDWDDGHPICGVFFSALIRTRGWGCNDLQFDVYFWDAQDALIRTRSIGNLPVLVGNDQEPAQVGAFDMMEESDRTRISAITYSVGGGSWLREGAGT
jgi:hypothetical protein